MFPSVTGEADASRDMMVTFMRDFFARHFLPKDLPVARSGREQRNDIGCRAFPNARPARLGVTASEKRIVVGAVTLSLLLSLSPGIAVTRNTRFPR